MREIVFDTETTGLSPLKGDRIVEIGCVELINRAPTGQTFHVYINPERDMPDGAFRVHGLSSDFLADKPAFSAIAEDFLNFIGDSVLIAHNASFDMGFINAELVRLKMPSVAPKRVIDTLQLARRKYPGGPNSLDALCQRYSIDNSRRNKHGALLDSEILAEVYIELTGGRNADLGHALVESKNINITVSNSDIKDIIQLPPTKSNVEIDYIDKTSIISKSHLSSKPYKKLALIFSFILILLYNYQLKSEKIPIQNLNLENLVKTEPEILLATEPKKPESTNYHAEVKLPAENKNVPQHVTIKEAANIRSGPSKTASVIKSVLKGTNFNVFQKSGSWIQVGDEAPVGWVFSELTQSSN